MLIKNGKGLFLRRYSTGWRDGWYTLPAGHLDGNEPVTKAMAREAKEETGIVVNARDLTVFHAMHRKSDLEYIDFFLFAKKWRKEPTIKELNRCDDMRWFSLKNPPKKVLPYVKSAIKSYFNGTIFSELDWKD